MDGSAPWKPQGYTSLSPYLITRNAGAVVDFLQAALGAVPLRRYEGPDGSILHAELRVDDSVLMIGEAGDGWPPVPCHLHLYVPDAYRTFRAAVEHGAEIVQEPTHRKGDPDRRGGVRDPGGNTWWFGTQVEADAGSGTGEGAA